MVLIFILVTGIARLQEELQYLNTDVKRKVREDIKVIKMGCPLSSSP